MPKPPKVDRRAELAWHPDFRDLEKLPDLRVVRTGTILNVISVAVALTGLALVGQQEVAFHQLSLEKADLSAKSEEDRQTLAARLKLSAEFSTAAERITALAKFGEGQPLGSDIVVLLSRLRPENVLYRSISITPKQAILRVEVRGAELDALLLVPTDLFRRFRESAELTAIFPTVVAPTFDPPVAGVLEFDLVLKR